MKMRPHTAADFYKVSHIDMYPEGTQLVYSNQTARADHLSNLGPDFDHKIVFVGLHGVMKWLLTDMWNKEFFRKKKSQVIRKYTERMQRALGPNIRTDHIEALHDLGYLPLEIKALAEGSRVNLRVPFYTIKNTLPEFFWLVNYLETQLSAETWKAITTATIAYEYRRLLEKYAEITGSPLDFVNWQGHDFAMRGMSGIFDAASSGFGHLSSFYGTDTIPALDYADDYYAGQRVPMLGGSVPATEHSVMCMGGKETEIGTFERLINKYPEGILSIVSDTWNFWDVLTVFTVQLKGKILARNGKLVFRPDSGDPVHIICGDPEAEVGSPAFKGAVECLWDVFGGETNAKGYRTLDQHVGLIYGDSITLSRARAILEGLEKKGFSSANIVFGIGSYTYQMITRDTFGQAVKATFGIVNGEARELFKDPITDNGTKKSARGLLRVEKQGDDFVLFDRQNPEQEQQGELKTVFLDGKITVKETIKKIRKRLHGDKL